MVIITSFDIFCLFATAESDSMFLWGLIAWVILKLPRRLHRLVWYYGSGTWENVKISFGAHPTSDKVFTQRLSLIGVCLKHFVGRQPLATSLVRYQRPINACCDRPLNYVCVSHKWSTWVYRQFVVRVLKSFDFLMLSWDTYIAAESFLFILVKVYRNFLAFKTSEKVSCLVVLLRQLKRGFHDVASLRSDWRSFWSRTDTWLASIHVWFLVFLGIISTSASWVFFIFLTPRPLSERSLLLLTMFRVQTASSHKAKLSIWIIFWSQWLQLSRLNTLSWISRSTKFTSLLAC